jgi:UDP-2,3-diacylglucosamine pyrophosphatase LpxH
MIKHKTIFLSDIHLASIGCKAQFLLNFLRNNEADTYYLVGDIIDGWRIKSKFYWPKEHTEVVQEILNLSIRGKKIIWIIGNHDEFLRPFLEYNLNFNNIEIKNEDEYMTADGKRLWVVHGDRFDLVIKYAKWLSFLGDNMYVLLIWLNHHLNRFRKCLGLKYWSLSAKLKSATKQAVQYMGEYAKVVGMECKDKGYDGVVCGHIHNPEIKMINDIYYYNTGDWVENCSCIVEDYSGEMKIIYYVEDEK